MSSDDEMSFEQEFPVVVTKKILSCLSLEDQKNAKLVCLTWKDVLENWIQLPHSNIVVSDGNWKAVMNSELPREEISVMDLRGNLTISSSRTPWISKVKSMIFLRGDQGSTGINIGKILGGSRDLIQLKFESGSLNLKGSDANGLKRLNLNSLKTLIVENFVKNEGSLDGIQGILENTFPVLETFALKFFQKPDFLDNTVTKAKFLKLYEVVYPFLGRHAGSLKNLVLDKPLQLTAMDKSPRLIPTLPLDLHQRLAPLKLNNLQLFTGSYEAAYSMDSSIAEGSTELQKLTVIGQPVHPGFIQVLQRNAATLQQITWMSSNLDGTTVETRFDMNALAESTRLTSLQVETTILLNFRSTPVSLVHLDIRFSLAPTEIAWIGNTLKNLETFFYRRNSLASEFFAAITVEGLRGLFFGLRNLKKTHAYCGQNLDAVRDYVQASLGIDFEPGYQASCGCDEVAIIVSEI